MDREIKYFKIIYFIGGLMGGKVISRRLIYRVGGRNKE
jgi:hypothetical protein